MPSIIIVMNIFADNSKKKTFGPKQALILVALLAIILVPRPVAGFLDLKDAFRFSVAGNQLEAAEQYISAAARIPWMPSLWEKAGEAYWAGKDISKAEKCFAAAIQRHALSPAGYVHLGDIAFIRGELHSAINLWKELLDQGGEPSILLPRIAQGYQALGDYFDEIQAWKEYLAIQPGDAAAHYRLGLLLVATAPGDALPELLHAARLEPGLDPTVQGLRTTLNKALLSGDHIYHLVVAGQALGALGEWNLAVLAFNAATREGSDHAEAWAWLGEARQQQGLDGSHEIEKALAIDPGSAMVQGLYGMFLQRKGKTAAALAAFHMAESREPDNPGWQIALGSASEQSGDLIAAYGYYLRGVELAPYDPSTWQALVAFSVTNDVDVGGTGMPAARKLVGLAPRDWRSFDLAGQAEFSLEKYQAAILYLKKAVLLGPLQAAPALHLGLAYLQTGDRASAYSYLSLARAFDPDGSYGLLAMRLLEQYFP